MKAIDQAKNLSDHRLDQFLEAALSIHFKDFQSTYAVALTKSPESHVDYFDLFFSWNFEEAWKTHKTRPSNKTLSEQAKWNPDEWVWYEDCPNQQYAGVSLFNGDDFLGPVDYSEDRSIQENLLKEYSHLSKLDVHVLFVKEVFANVVSKFRRHPLTNSTGIADVPFQLYVPGCPSHGEQYWKVSRSWNTNVGG